MDNVSLGCLDYNEVLSYFYSLKQSIEWTSLTSVRVLFGVIYGTILLGGLVGNGGVIGVLVWGRGLTARNVLLLNLMCADLLLCFTAVPITPVVIVWKQWFLGSFMCRCLPLAQSASVMLISWTLAIIAIDKFVHIHDPTKMPVRKHEAGLLVIGSWLLAIVLNVPFALSYQLMAGSQVVEPGAMPFCGEFCVESWWQVVKLQRIYGTLVLVVQFVAPMVVITYCYARLLYIVHSDLLVSQRKYSCLLSRMQYQKACQIQRKATYILVAMVLAFLLSWAPLTVMNILKDYAVVPAFVHEQVYVCGLITHSTAMSSVVLNPILCFWLTKQGKPKKLKVKQLTMEHSVPLHLYTPARRSPSTPKPEGRQRDEYAEGGSVIVRDTRV